MEIAEAIGKLIEAVEKIPNSQGFLYLSIFANLAIIGTAGFVFYQHWVQGKQERRVRAHERIAQWNDPHFTEQRAGVFKFLADPEKSPQDKLEKYRSDEKWRATIVQMINFFEVLGQAINDDVVDEESAKRFFEGILDSFYKSAFPIIVAFRELDTDSLADIVWLAHRWAAPSSG